MRIKMLELIEGAKKAQGLTVIIDVFRAFSVACYIINNGARYIIPVGDINIAYDLKKANSDFVLIGERQGKKQPGFDYGNSPAEIESVSFIGKSIIQTTGAGTQGIVNAHNADEIITGSFVNAQAIIDYIKFKKPEIISLVCMGNAGVVSSSEDTLCAEYIESGLENRQMDFNNIVKYLERYESSQKFFNHETHWAPEKDFKLCLSLNRFDFVLRVEKLEDKLILKKVNTPI
ncbi:MAG: 2-phosphosulfolactate phosphatase [Peptococcaceae bacterium]